MVDVKQPSGCGIDSKRREWAVARLPKGDTFAMTEDQGQPPPSGQPQHGRHHRDAPNRTPGRNRTVIILALVVAIVAAAGVITWFVRSDPTTSAGTSTAAATNSARPSSAGSRAAAASGGASTMQTSETSGTESSCTLPGGSLTVAVSPDIADAIDPLITTSGSSSQGIAGGCTVAITPVDAADFVAGGGSGAAVWIPDSSMWIDEAKAAGMTVPAQNPSIATSPVVLALSASAAAPLAAAGSPSVAGILASRATATPIRVGLPDPTKSAAAVATILATRAAVTGTSDARAALTWAVRSSPAGMPTHDGDLLDRLTTDPNTAVPVSERALMRHNAAAGATPAVAVYLGQDESALDYPVVTLATDSDTVAAANDLVRLLMGTEAQSALRAAGFRAPDGTPGPSITSDNGVDPTLRVTAPLPGAQQVDDAIRSVQITNEPTRMLAVMDISGSMLGVVPGAGGATRLELAKDAATRGLGLYGPDSDIGLWEFSRTLTPDSDHRELIPVSSLGPDGQGSSGAQRLAQAMAGLQAVPEGGTGLYDTVLDAVRTMRASYDPARVNVVLVLTDGKNDDQGSISLDGLISTLTAEQDANRPVPVISIAFGPDSDVQSLSAISKATGGATYESKDPRQIGEIFLDAVGQRLCRPSC